MANPNRDADAKLDHDSFENCFSELRRLARSADVGMKEVKSRIEEISDGTCSDFDEHSNETAALLFLRRSQKDIKEINSNVKSIQEDFKMRSSALKSVSDLFECALESFKQRLENVESFTEQYGYERPVCSFHDDSKSPLTNEERIVIDEKLRDVEDVKMKNVTKCIDNFQAQEDMLNFMNDGETKNPSDSNPCTPKLEDIGLSEDTMFKLNSGYFDNYDRHTPQRNLFTKNSTHYLVDSSVSSRPVNELSTPKLEDYGISEHTLNYIHKDNRNDGPMEKTENVCFDSPPTPKFDLTSVYNNFKVTTKIEEEEKSKEQFFDLPPTPKLDGLSEHTLMFLNTAVDKENISLDSTPAGDHALCQTKASSYSDLPETPKLDSYGLSQYTLRFLNTKEENKRNKNYFDFDMPATPKLDGISEQTMMFLNDNRK